MSDRYGAGGDAGAMLDVLRLAGGARNDAAVAGAEMRYDAVGTDGVDVELQELVEAGGAIAGVLGGAITGVLKLAVGAAAAEELAITPDDDATALPPGEKHRPGVGGLNGIPATVVNVMRSGGPGSGYSSAVPAVLRHSPSAICPGRSMSPTYMSG